MDFLSFSISEVPEFFDQSSQNGEKIHFLAPASRVSQKFWEILEVGAILANLVKKFGHFRDRKRQKIHEQIKLQCKM